MAQRRNPVDAMIRAGEDAMGLPEEYRLHWLEHGGTIRERLQEFGHVPASEYVWELLFCLLTPQSRAAHAEIVIARLREERFLERPFDPTPILRTPAHYIRFHNEKGRRLLEVARRGEEIGGALRAPLSSREKREWLVANVRGLGWKEASHLLRNIGHLDLAIIDRHILRHMLRLGAIEEMPATTGTRRAYLELERRFAELAVRSGLALQELDLLFWSMEEGSVRK